MPQRELTAVQHAVLQPLFAEHAKPTHATKRAVHDQLRPVLAVIADVNHQIMLYADLIQQAELTAEGAELAPLLANMHSTMKAALEDGAAANAILRRLAQTFGDLDRYIAERKTVLAPATPSTTTSELATAR